MTTERDPLPELPATEYEGELWGQNVPLWDACSMHAYARAAVSNRDARIAELEAMNQRQANCIEEAGREALRQFQRDMQKLDAARKEQP